MEVEASTDQNHWLRKVDQCREKTKGHAAYDIGKIWLFTKTLKELRLIWTFTTFNNWIAQALFAIMKWIDELNALKPKNMELEH